MPNHQDYFLLSTQDHPGGEASLELNNSTDAIASIFSMEDVAKRIIAMRKRIHITAIIFFKGLDLKISITNHHSLFLNICENVFFATSFLLSNSINT